MADSDVVAVLFDLARRLYSHNPRHCMIIVIDFLQLPPASTTREGVSAKPLHKSAHFLNCEFWAARLSAIVVCQCCHSLGNAWLKVYGVATTT